jgi:hypothetical protein
LQTAPEKLCKQFIDTGQTSVLLSHDELIGKVWFKDLTKVASLVAWCYSASSWGTPPRDLVCLFRSLLLKNLAGYTGITRWVQALESFPFFAILSGFVPDDVPGVGTFYDFIGRLWQAEKRSATKIRKPLARRRRKGKKNEVTFGPSWYRRSAGEKNTAAGEQGSSSTAGGCANRDLSAGICAALRAKGSFG